MSVWPMRNMDAQKHSSHLSVKARDAHEGWPTRKRYGTHDVMMLHAVANRNVILPVVVVLALAHGLAPTLAHAAKYASAVTGQAGHAATQAVQDYAYQLISDSYNDRVVAVSVDQNDQPFCLPSTCVVDKTVLAQVAFASGQTDPKLSFDHLSSHPAGFDPGAVRGPPRI